MFTDVRAVLFDLDGTLLDSAPDLGGAADRLRQVRGLAPLPLHLYRPHAGSGARGMLRVAFDMAPEHPDYEAMREAFFVAYESCLLERTQAFDGVEDMLRRLQGIGLPWGVVTNKAKRFTVPITRGLGFFDSAGAIVCGDTTPHAKPHPEPLFEAARRLGVAPIHCIYVGDDPRDIAAGKAAGMRTVAAGYGYLGPQADIRQWGADACIDFPAQVLQLLDLP